MQGSDWAGTNASWSSNVNPGWNGTGVPNAVGATANHPGSTNSTTTQDTGAAVTVGTISLTNNSNNRWEFILTNGITLNQDGAGAGTATISNTNTSANPQNFIHLGVTTPGTLTLADDLLISNTGASTAANGAIQISSTIVGTGNLTLSSVSNTVTSVTSFPGAIRIQTGSNTFTGSVLVRKGAVTFNNSASFGNSANVITLGQSGQGSATLVSTNGGTVVPNNITVASGSGGTLVLGSNSDAVATTGYSGTITLNGDVSLTSASVTGSNTITFSNTISGVGSVTKVGAGSLTLSGSNTFTGNTVLATGNGALVLSNTNALQNSTLNYTGSTLTFSSTVGSHAFTLGGLTGSANIALQDNAGTPNAVALSVGNNNTSPAAYSGILSGPGSLTKVGSGTLTLSGTNTYSGDTTISAGTLKLGAANVIPDGAAKGNVSVTGTLDLNTFSETINGLSGAGTVDTVAGGTPTLTVGNNNQTSTFSGVIKNTAGSLALSKIGTGTLTLSGTNSYSGGTTISAGTLQMSGNTFFGLGSNSAPLTVNGGTLDLNGTDQAVGAFSGTGGTVTNNAASAVNTFIIGFGGGGGTFSGVLADGTGTLTLQKNGTGTEVFSGTSPNTYSGQTVVTQGELDLNKTAGINAIAGNLRIQGPGTGPPGTVKLLASNQISDTALVSLANNTAPVFDLNGFDETIGALADINAGSNSTVQLGSGALTFGDSSNRTYSGTIAGTGGKLVKQGSGTEILGGTTTNTYTGKTTVSAGTLALNKTAGVNAIGSTGASGANAANTDIQITGGSVRLDADNQIVDTAKLGLSGGTLNLNGKSEGVATVSGGTTTSATAGLGALTLSANSIIDFGVGDNGNKLVFSGVDSHTLGTLLQIINWDGAPATGSGSEQLLFAGNGSDFTNIYNQNDVIFNGGAPGYLAIQFSGFYEITEVPEPSTCIAAALALSAIGYSQRRRFRSGKRFC